MSALDRGRVHAMAALGLDLYANPDPGWATALDDVVCETM
jgi:hypothetical protein